MMINYDYGDALCMGYEHYNRRKARLELLEILAEAEDDVRSGRVAPVQDTFDEIRNELTGERSVHW